MWIALDVMVAAQIFDTPENGEVRPPSVPEKLDDRDYDCDADTGNRAEDGDAREADHGEPELPLLNSIDASEVRKFEQAEGCGNDDSGECAIGQIAHQIGCSDQQNR